MEIISPSISKHLKIAKMILHGCSVFLKRVYIDIEKVNTILSLVANIEYSNHYET